jgi:phosphodiesterase/alkaline phosphatase D-like protein
MKARFLVVALAAVFAAIMTYTPPQLAAQVDITQGPVLESVSDHSAVIAWSTNKDGSTVVNYGTDPRNLAQVAEAPWGANGRTHRVELRNLQPNTTYYFRVETGQTRGGNGAAVETQGVINFRTQPEGAPPIHERPR